MTRRLALKLEDLGELTNDFDTCDISGTRETGFFLEKALSPGGVIRRLMAALGRIVNYRDVAEISHSRQSFLAPVVAHL